MANLKHLDRAAADASHLLKNFPSLVTGRQGMQQQQQRLFSGTSMASSFRYVNRRLLAKLEQEANAMAQDPTRQAALYKVQKNKEMRRRTEDAQQQRVG